MTKTRAAAYEKRLASMKISLEWAIRQRDAYKACVLEAMDDCRDNDERANLMDNRYFREELRRLRSLENKVYNLTRQINQYN